jgi:toxin ParE1/3/4
LAQHNLVVTEEAEADIREGFRWYQRQAGLGKDFVAEVEERLAFIEQSPFAYQVIEQGIRRAVVHRFPYNVYYMISGSRINVLAVWPGSRSQGRLFAATRNDSEGHLMDELRGGGQ